MSDVPPIPSSDNPFGAPPSTPPISDVPDKEACQWAMFCHLASLVGYVGIPLGNLLGPLVVWLISREKHPFIDDQGKESLNFQITVTLLLLISGITVCVGIGFVLLIVVAIYGVIMPIIAAVKSNKGELYRYPATMRLIT
jgi:uncharacterized Tic20 family protein